MNPAMDKLITQPAFIKGIKEQLDVSTGVLGIGGKNLTVTPGKQETVKTSVTTPSVATPPAAGAGKTLTPEIVSSYLLRAKKALGQAAQEAQIRAKARELATADGYK